MNDRRMMKTTLLILTVLFFSGVCPAQIVELDLQKCRKMAVENSKKLQSAEQQGQKAGFDKKAYRANFLPKLSATGLYAYVHKKMKFDIDGGYLPVYDVNDVGQAVPLNSLYMPEGKPVLGADGIPLFKQYAFMPDIDLALGIENAYTVGVMLEQPLYMGGKVRSAFRMASIGKEIADLNVKYNQAEVLAEADAAYWQYLKVCEQVKAAGKYLEVVKELVRNLEDAYRTGMAAQNDLLKAQVKQNEAELMVQKAQNGLALSGMNLCRIVGVDLMSELTVRDSLGEGIVSGLWEEGDNITGRPEYNMLERQIELKEKEVALTRSDFLPQLGVAAAIAAAITATSSPSSARFSSAVCAGAAAAIAAASASFAALASLKIPIYHWGEGRNKVKAMKAEEEMVRLKKEETEQMMQLEVARARYNVEDAATRVRLTRRSLSQAEENLQVSKNRFEVGMETLTNYMEAQAQWQKAWSDWIEAKAELRVNETYYLKSTGRLSD